MDCSTASLVLGAITNKHVKCLKEKQSTLQGMLDLVLSSKVGAFQKCEIQWIPLVAGNSEIDFLGNFFILEKWLNPQVGGHGIESHVLFGVKLTSNTPCYTCLATLETFSIQE